MQGCLVQNISGFVMVTFGLSKEKKIVTSTLSDRSEIVTWVKIQGN